MTQSKNNNGDTPANNEEAAINRGTGNDNAAAFAGKDAATIKGFNTPNTDEQSKTSQKKEYGDTQLNKGLESQAMDAEGTNL